MDHVVIGTAGHVDHGKTTLIRSLTGIETDRLPEEKKRGISIDLGFARFVLPSGRVASIIDVPGHERFIKNMVAGVAGIDLVLLVVAADEGVMPQTREHLDILQLLGVRNGLTVLNKIDLTEPDWLTLVEEDVQQALEGSFLEDAPIVPVSAHTGQGLQELRQIIDDMVPRVQRRYRSSKVRLPVDRVFSVAGFGTVVTGTLLSGRVIPEQRLELQPGDLKVRVRQVQVHGQTVQEAAPGQRAAINLSGIEKHQVRRGMVLVEPGTWQSGSLIAAEVSLLPRMKEPLLNNQRVRWHSGTSEVLGRVLLLDRDELVPGEAALMLFKAEEPLLVVREDRFILRSYSPMHTIGGGRVLETHKRYKRFHPEHLAELRLKASGNREDLLMSLLAKGPVHESDLCNELGMEVSELAEMLSQLGDRVIRLNESWWMTGGAWEALVGRVERLLQDYHRENRLMKGMSLEHLRGLLGKDTSSRASDALMRKLEDTGLIVLERDLVRLNGWQPNLTAQEEATAARLKALLLQGKCSPPSPGELAEQLGLPLADVQALLRFLSEQGEVVRIDQDFYLEMGVYREVISKLKDFLTEKGTISMGEFRDLLQTTRKYAVPLAEYLDAQRVTRRLGDQRSLY